jgi:hypothetical protein
MMARPVSQIAIRANGSSVDAIYSAVREIVNDSWPAAMPTTMQKRFDITRGIVAEIVALAVGEGAPAALGSVAVHFLFTQWGAGAPTVADRFASIRSASRTGGRLAANVLSVPAIPARDVDSIPEDLRFLYGRSYSTWLHPATGTILAIDVALPYPLHQFAGVEADLSEVAA